MYGATLRKTFINWAILVVACGTESWVLTNKMGRDLIACKRKIIRKICGPMYENGYWGIKMN